MFVVTKGPFSLPSFPCELSGLQETDKGLPPLASAGCCLCAAAAASGEMGRGECVNEEGRRLPPAWRTGGLEGSWMFFLAAAAAVVLLEDLLGFVKAQMSAMGPLRA